MAVVQMIRKPVLQLDPNDDVAIAARPLKAGTHLPDQQLDCAQDIPAGHKVAIKPIAQGEPVRRYNQIIGFATAAIAAGDHVHSHNLAFETFDRDYAVGKTSSRPPRLPSRQLFRAFVAPMARSPHATTSASFPP